MRMRKKYATQQHQPANNSLYSTSNFSEKLKRSSSDSSLTYHIDIYLLHASWRNLAKAVCQTRMFIGAYFITAHYTSRCCKYLLFSHVIDGHILKIFVVSLFSSLCVCANTHSFMTYYIIIIL